MASTLVLGLLGAAGPATASSVTSASFTGGTGTVSVGGGLYAKNGGALTLTVATSSDTKCVEVSGAHAAKLTSSAAKSSWTFPFTAETGDGVKTVSAVAFPNFNSKDNCSGNNDRATASYVLDNTGPTLTATLSSLPNTAGWNKSNVSIAWSATDVGSGVSSGPTPATDSVTTNGASVTKTATATDALGNSGTGSVTVNLDKTAPTITGSRLPAANAFGWNNADVTVSFSCSDGLSGVKSCTGPTTLSSNGAGQSVTGAAVDVADNTTSASVSNINIDKAPPTLSGAPVGSPNGAGWYNSNVAVLWTCADLLSGINGACPANSSITGEGTGLTASTSVSDKAGNAASATSAPAVSIDKTAPVTSANAPTNWNNVDVTVTLVPADALSGVQATSFKLDGGTTQSGTTVAVSTDGVHSLEYWSVDKAGNEEVHKTVQVKIDKTPPTITHGQSPAANVNGWNNTAVTVTFSCSDGAGSGIQSCGPNQTITTEGKNQAVTGTAIDNAGNSATDPATVSIDRTAPTIGAARDRTPNDNGWYKADVIVSFTCGDSLSGIDSCSLPATLGQGANQSAMGTAVDAAGNSASATENGIKVDKTAPSLSGVATTGPNGNGWYSGEVTIHWTASDVLSGLAADPGDDLLTGEGDNVCATKSVTDLAGNSTTETVCVKIDRHSPNTSASVPKPLASGWYAAAVPVTLTGVDPLSDVDKTYYQVDGGATQVYSGVFNFGSKGIHTITFWSMDNAGNTEDKTASGHTITVKIDGIAPTIVGSRSPVANGFGWNNGDVSVSFDCSDAESGIAGCVGAQTLTNEGAGQSVIGTATDNAGNDASATVGDISIDKTPPALAGAATTAANGAGWYRDNVVIRWTGQDGLSGIDTGTTPGDSTITGEGRSLGAGPVSVFDKAGNSTAASVSGIKIDRKGPTISGGPTTVANGAGWYNGDVVVAFTCSDPALVDSTAGALVDSTAGSGIAICPSDKLVSGNDAGQSVTSDPAGDLAGNTTVGKTVGGINIDGLLPESSADNVCTSKNGWCKGNTATVKVTAVDQALLSGVKEIRTSLNGGPFTTTKGATAEVNVPLNGSGVANVRYYAVDNADNAEAPNSVALKFDNIAPTVTHTLSPVPNADEWNNSNVTVHFIAKDDDTGSGVDPATVTPDQIVSTETSASGQVVNGGASDLAGNLGTDSATVKLDKTAPTITGAVSAGTLGTGGWYTGPVTVHFTCDDALSGIGVCPGDVTLAGNGAGQSVSGTAQDKAGNSASATVSGIKIDAEKPGVTLQGIIGGGIYTLGAAPTASCTAGDNVSGPASCTVNVTGGQANGVGTFTYTATAKDNAGNVQTATGTYRVVYRTFDGFLQPINDTAHQIGAEVSVFKAGSTVPVKFQLRKADGSVVQASSAPQWLTPAKGSLTTASIDEITYADAPTTGGTYRWDATAQQYIYNWGTAKNQAGYYWRIGVKLDDGNTYTVSIGLR